MVLVLPCDWRFLPKLGLRALRLRGPFLFMTFVFPCPPAFSK